jgi:hypothetical protein
MTKTKQIWNTLTEFNRILSSIKFAIEKNYMNPSAFLDLTKHHECKNLKFSIYRKLTWIDIIIPISSCHPCKYKLSNINYPLNWLHIYPLTKSAKESGLNTIKNILHNNEYNTNPIWKPTLPQKQSIHTVCQCHNTKCVTFTYSAEEVRIITKLFHDTQK